MRKNTLTFKINNNGLLNVMQNEINTKVVVKNIDENRHYKQIAEILPEDFVMLINFYRHIKENDIQNDFINPFGKNKEQED